MSTTSAPQTAPAAPEQAAPAAAGQAPARNGNGNGKRTLLLLLAAGVLVIAGVAYGLYWALVLQYRQSTDDAYVNGNIVQVTPQIPGTVISINADDTQSVTAGHTLVELDPVDAKVALAEAEAHLAITVRSVRSLFATSAQLQAAQSVRQSDLANAEKDLERREHLAGTGAVSGEDLQHAREAVASARASLLAARQQLAATRARIDGTTVEDHPDVRDAAAAVHTAYLNLARTQLPAPVSGYIARRNVQLGQRVAPGAVLMDIVPLEQVWVDANFKELQIDAMRVGQPVTLTADLYGGSVPFHGTVVGFSAGTGASFALLPAQNATGNWIKVVQRLPVRIRLDPRELAAHPLQIGLSMRVQVATRDRSGARLPQKAEGFPAYRTTVFNDADRQADARVHAIVEANLAGGSGTGPRAGEGAGADADGTAPGADEAAADGADAGGSAPHLRQAAAADADAGGAAALAHVPHHRPRLLPAAAGTN